MKQIQEIFAMIEVLSVKNMRLSDAYTIEHYIGSKTLMYNAGKAVFDSIAWHGSAAIIAGSGNNAGDGYVIARLLNSVGVNVHIYLLKDKFSDDGRYYFDECLSDGIAYSIYGGESLSGYDYIIDCIFGTGFHGVPHGVAKTAIEQINASGAYIVSVDINSGINGDSGRGEIYVRSDLTVSIGSYKTGHFIGYAADCIGRLINCDIGIKPIMPTYKYVCTKADIESTLKTLGIDEYMLVPFGSEELENYDISPAQSVISLANKKKCAVAVKDGGAYIVASGGNAYIIGEREV